MAFHDVELPTGFQYSSIAGAGFGTIIQETASGHEYRVARQSQGRHRFRLVKGLQTEAEAKALKAFALGRRGALHSWKLTDFSDYTSASDGVSAPDDEDQVLGTADGTETTFQLVKTYDASGDAPYSRAITLPKSGTVVVSLDNVNTTAFTVNGSGQVVLDSAPANGVVVKAGFEFCVPVRFSAEFDAWAQLQADAYQIWSLPTLDAVEVLSEVELPERWTPGGARDWGEVAADIAITLNDGKLHRVLPTANINLWLPPVNRIPGGHVFTVHVPASSSNTIQIKDDIGTNVGSTFGSSGATRHIGLVHGASTSTWVVY